MKASQELQDAVTNFPGIFSIGDMQGNSVALSPHLPQILGYTTEEYLKKHFTEYVHPEDLPFVIEQMKVLSADGGVTRSIPQRWQRKDGTYIWLNWRARSSGGLIYATATDITKERELEVQNRESQVQFDQILKNAPGMIYRFVMEQNGTMHFPFASDKAFEIYEIQPEDFRVDPSLMLKMVHPDDQGELQKSILQSAESLEQFEWSGRIITKTGKTRWIKARSIPQRHSDGTTVWDGIVMDMTRESMLEKELEQQRMVSFHSARLASIGELAAGVGHEINNPLAIVMGKSERLRRKLQTAGALSEEFDRDIAVQLDACNRIRRIVDGLRTFSRKSSDPNPAGDVIEAINGTVALVREIYARDGISIKVDVPANPIFVRCEEAEIQQVVMNLLANARDATKGKSDALVAVRIEATGDRVKVHIRDNGKGIPAAVQPKIFESFFTTKPVGEGTGLGLALARSIVVSAGGSISFESAEGVGTEFLLQFPCGGMIDHALPQMAEANSSGKKLTGKILLVDDEPDVREVLADSLRDLGLEVTSAAGVTQALAACESQSFDLVMTDLKMPGRGGDELLRALRSSGSQPLPKSIIMTGAAAKGPEVANLADGVLTKPFSEQQLADTITALLRKTST